MIRSISCCAVGAAFAMWLGSATAWAADAPATCITRPARQQLVCSADTCLRIETQRICDTARRPVAHPRAHVVSREEVSQRRLEQLIASID